jgi:hypothetical protein
MAHPLEAATLAAVKEHENFKKQVATLTDGVRSLERALDKSEGENDELRRQLLAAQERGDHFYKCNTELVTQLQNINMFIQDAVMRARVEIEKRGNEAEVRVKQLTDDFIKGADVTLNDLESSTLRNGKSVDNSMNAAV